MKSFKHICNELGLKKYLASELGTLYFVPIGQGSPRLIVRHFDRDLPIAFVKPYAEIVHALQEWIEAHPNLANLIRVEQPIEVGNDFIARRNHTYLTSTSSYAYDEDPPDPPDELDRMRKIFQNVIGKTNNPKDKIVEGVLRRSVIEPSGKTFFSGKESRFIIVDPKMVQEDIEQWVALNS